MQEAGATADIELAYISDGLEYIRTGLSTGMKSMSSLRAFLFWAIGMNHFEIAKMRGRMIWAKLVKQF
jgi:methylmalonyl-CoA mutase